MSTQILLQEKLSGAFKIGKTAWRHPGGGAYSLAPDSLTGKEGAGCPSPKTALRPQQHGPKGRADPHNKILRTPLAIVILQIACWRWVRSAVSGSSSTARLSVHKNNCSEVHGYVATVHASYCATLKPALLWPEISVENHSMLIIFPYILAALLYLRRRQAAENTVSYSYDACHRPQLLNRVSLERIKSVPPNTLSTAAERQPRLTLYVNIHDLGLWGKVVPRLMCTP